MRVLMVNLGMNVYLPNGLEIEWRQKSLLRTGALITTLYDPTQALDIKHQLR